jgi:hypothetical protein
MRLFLMVGLLFSIVLFEAYDSSTISSEIIETIDQDVNEIPGLQEEPLVNPYEKRDTVDDQEQTLEMINIKPVD